MSVAKEKAFVSVVVYVYNQQRNIKDFLTKIDDFFYSKFESYEFIIVNNGSVDATKMHIEEVVGSLRAPATLVSMAWKHSQDLAILAGDDLAVGDYVYEFDALKMDYDIALIYDVFKKAVSGFDLVSASPFNKVRWSSRLFYWLFRKLSHLSLELSTETFRVLSRRMLNAVSKSGEKVRYRKVLYQYSGFSSYSLKYTASHSAVEQGSFFERMSLATELVLSFSNFGSNLSIFVSGLFFISSVLLGVYALVARFTFSYVIAGWTTIMLFLAFGFSGLFFVVGLIGRYLSIILLEVKGRSLYTIAAIKQHNKY